MATATYPGKLRSPRRQGAACRTEMKGQRVAAFGWPYPGRSLTGEGDLLAAEARLVADYGARAALALQAVAHGDARWFALNRKVKLPAGTGGASCHRSAPWLSICVIHGEYWCKLTNVRFGNSVSSGSCSASVLLTRDESRPCEALRVSAYGVEPGAAGGDRLCRHPHESDDAGRSALVHPGGALFWGLSSGRQS